MWSFGVSNTQYSLVWLALVRLWGVYSPSVCPVLQVCELLLTAGADVNTEDQDKQSPLHMACKNVNPDVVDHLLAHGACVNTMCYSGNAPMQNVLKVFFQIWIYLTYKNTIQPHM